MTVWHWFVFILRPRNASPNTGNEFLLPELLLDPFWNFRAVDLSYRNVFISEFDLISHP